MKVDLGKTGLRINPLIFGTLPLGPLQAGMAPEEGGRIIRRGLDLGIDTLDTAQVYRTYPHVRAALEGFEGEVKIISKTHAKEAGLARSHVESGLEKLGRDYFDIVHLHGAGDPNPFESRSEILDELLRLRDEGKIRHVGISTHWISVVREAATHPDIDVIHPLININGMGIRDGSADEMAEAIKWASEVGKGIYAMKALAGGNLIERAVESLRYVNEMDGVHALALGMLTEAEVDANFALINDKTTQGHDWTELTKRKREIRIMSIVCKGCGKCVKDCTNNALTIKDGLAVVSRDKCILCGYCAANCPEFAIRVA